MPTNQVDGRSAMRGLLAAVNEDLGAPIAPAWEEAFWALPRHAFLPDTVWVGDGLEECSRQDSPKDWLGHAYEDDAVVTQVNDGQDPGDGERWASCSASAPSVVLRMLDMLDVSDTHNVLEIGTGTGWTAGLLAHRVRSGSVTSIEVDPVLAALAANRLKEAGVTPQVVCGDGALGHEDSAPYDRVQSTCSVRTVPPAWISQTKPGGLILTAWESPWLCYGLLRLTVDGHGTACGSFFPYSAFMLMRGQRTDLRIYRDVVREDHVPDESSTRLPPHAVAANDVAAQFAVGLQLGNVWHTWHHNPDVEGVVTRLWLATTDATSWAAVDWDGTSDERYTVWEYGPRRLWSEVTAAYRWWDAAGWPGPERFGMTISPDGTHTVWLDTPDRFVPQTG